MELLRDARAHELALFEDLRRDRLLGPQAHHLEPPLWELGHVAWFQELWLLRHLRGEPAIEPARDGIYDSFGVSYRRRWDHDYPSRDATLAYAAEVLERCIDRLAAEPSAEDAYFHRLVALHEDMHAENLIGVRQTLGYDAPAMLGTAEPQSESGYEPHDVAIAGSRFPLGAPRDTPFVFDNEKWAHPVEVAPFRISSTAVTNAEFARFVDAGGYATRRFWTKHGWSWRKRAAAEQPLFWVQRDGTWCERRFDRVEPLRPWHPVCHVNWHEARAFCRYAGRRLPTEAEWEMAAAWDPGAGRKRTFPWGEHGPTPEHANLDWSFGGTVDVRALPAGDSPTGCRQMIGNVWEWTDSLLEPYPDFEVDPYAEYSAPYFGQKPVLRGGCWATRARLIRSTWRNFFIRHRRNVYAGFRTCAR